MVMFEIKQMNPETYRRETRRSTFIVIAIFVVLVMTLSTLSVMLLGEPGGDNFRWNLAGVIAGLLLTAALVRLKFWSQPWMASAAYGWRLKRSLMRITNVMHHLTTAVAAGDPSALKLLRFYHLGLTQMHQLDGNSSSLSQMAGEINRHREQMETLGIETEQTGLESAWLDAVKPGGVTQ